MDNVLFNWLLEVTQDLATLGTWLTTPLPYINASPLAMFTPPVLTALIGWHLLRLIVGG